METSKTQSLLKALALDFLHNKTFNTSILQLLSNEQKVHASTTVESIKAKVTLIDKTLLLLKHQSHSKTHTNKLKKHSLSQTLVQRNFYHMVNVFVFNISATNEHYINQIQTQMAESTASQPASHMNNTFCKDNTFYKDKMAVDFLRQQLQTYFVLLTQNSPFFLSIVTEIENDKRKATSSQLGLLQTLDYLCVKYSISNEFTDKVVEILQKNEHQMQESSSKASSSTIIKSVNQMLFSSQKQNQLYHILQTNPQVSIKNMLSVINANYLHTNPVRKIFSSGQLSGKQALEGIVVRMIKRVGKNELFNEKSQDYTPLRLVLLHFLNKHFSVYAEFNSLVTSLMNDQPLNSEHNLNLVKKIQRTFRLTIPIQNAHFCHLLHLINSQLATRYSEPVALELIKKLLLNRLLLNPSFYILYHNPDEEHVKQYVETANAIRALFYPSKAEELAHNLNCPPLLKVSTQILNSLQYCLKTDHRQSIDGSNFLYINDKILKTQILQLHNQLQQNIHANRQTPKQSPKHNLNLPNLVSDYSLSFSLVKNQHPTRNHLSHPIIENVSEVKFPSTTNRSHNLKDNQSMRQMYEQLKTQTSQQHIPPRSPQKNLKPNRIENNHQNKPQGIPSLSRVSQLARKQHQLQNETRLFSMKLPTDREMIEELVEMRKEYGEVKRGLKKELEQRKSKHNKKMTQLRSFTTRFNSYKEQMQTDNHSLYIHMTTIA